MNKDLTHPGQEAVIEPRNHSPEVANQIIAQVVEEELAMIHVTNLMAVIGSEINIASIISGDHPESA